MLQALGKEHLVSDLSSKVNLGKRLKDQGNLHCVLWPLMDLMGLSSQGPKEQLELLMLCPSRKTSFTGLSFLTRPKLLNDVSDGHFPNPVIDGFKQHNSDLRGNFQSYTIIIAQHWDVPIFIKSCT